MDIDFSNVRPNYDEEVKQDSLPNPGRDQYNSTMQNAETSFGEMFSSSMKYDTIGGLAYRKITNNNGFQDPDYKLSNELLDKYGTGIPQEYWEEFQEAESEDGLSIIRGRLLDRMRHEQNLMNSGWEGYAAQFTAAVADPINFVTGGLGAGANVASKGRRLTNMLRAGMVTAGTNMAIDTALIANDPFRDYDELIYSGVAGALFGGTAGAFQKVQQKTLKEIEYKQVKDYGLTLTPKGEKYFKDVALVKDAPKNLDELDAEDTAQGFGHWTSRISSTGILKNSNSTPEQRYLANIMLEDGVGNGNKNTKSIALDQQILYDTRNGSFNATATQSFKDYGKANGINYLARDLDKGRSNFMELAGRYVRGTVGEDVPEQVKTIANKARETFQAFLKDAKEAGLKGFENVDIDPKYLTRMWRKDSIARATADHGDDAVVRTLVQSLIKGSKGDIAEDVSQKVIKGMLRKIRLSGFGDELSLSQALNPHQREGFKELLQESGELSGSEIDDILDRLAPKDAGKINRAKQSLPFDESYVDPETGLKVEDLLENNLERIMNTYSRQLSGHIAFARAGFKSVSEWKNYRTKVRENAIKSGKQSEGQLRRREEILDLMEAQILGRPVEEIGAINTAATLMKDLNYTLIGGGFARASLPEIMEVFSHVGVKATLTHLPALRKAFKRMANGDLEDGFYRELEALGIGHDINMQSAFQRYDFADSIDLNNLNQTSTTSKIYQGLGTARKLTGKYSGLAPLTKYYQMWAASAQVQQLVHAAHNVGRKQNKKYLLWLGLDDAMSERVFKQLRDKAEFTKSSITGKKIRTIKFDQWDDLEAADAFRTALVRSSNRLIQKQSIGELPPFMSKTFYQVLFQFMSFGMAAYEKKTVNAFYQRDIRTAMAIMTTSATASMVYALNQWSLSLSEEDPQSFLEERLKADNIVKAGIQMGGYSSLLPTAIDSVYTPMMDEPLFAYARSSGLASNIWEGNPTYSTLTRAGSLATGSLRSAIDSEYSFSKQNYQDLKGLMPWHTAPVIQNAYRLLDDNLPSQSQY